MHFRFMMIDKKMLWEDDLPEGLRQYAPLPGVTMTDFGIVHEDELTEKLAYFLHGTSPEWHDKILVTRYPEAWPVLTLRDMCKAFGVT